MLFFFGLSAGACRGLLGVRVWGSCLGSWWIVGDTRIGGGCGFRRGGEGLGGDFVEGVVARALFPVRVNDVAHLGRKNLVSSSCGLGCCGGGEGFRCLLCPRGVSSESGLVIWTRAAALMLWVAASTLSCPWWLLVLSTVPSPLCVAWWLGVGLFGSRPVGGALICGYSIGVCWVCPQPWVK